MDILFNDFRMLLSILFIFIGSSVFYIASLISGHNLYRDIEFRLSIFITTIIGFFIFTFSPLSFITLFPSLFHIPHIDTDNITQISIESLHKVIIDEALFPYLLSAIGIGVVFGCFSSIQMRSLFLHRLRKIIGIDFPIRTYEFAWDDFLCSIKRNGQIKLKKQNNSDEDKFYQLVGFSIKSEPKELILKEINNENSIDILVTNIDDIKKICVPPESFKKNYHSETPSSYALHLVLASLGLIMLFESFHLTGDFLIRENYKSLAELYRYSELGFLATYILLAWMAFKFLRREYNHKNSAFILCYFPVFFLFIGISIMLWIISHITFQIIFFEFFDQPLLELLCIITSSSIIAIILTLTILWQYRRYNSFKNTLDNAIKNNKNNSSLLKKLESVILSFDENNHNYSSLDNLELNYRQYSEVIDLLEQLKNNLKQIESLSFLADEKDIQLVKSCFWYIKNLE